MILLVREDTLDSTYHCKANKSEETAPLFEAVPRLTVRFVVAEVPENVIGVNVEAVPIGKTAVEDVTPFNVNLPELDASI